MSAKKKDVTPHTVMRSKLSKSVFSDKLIDVGFNCIPDDNDRYTIVAARACEMMYTVAGDRNTSRLEKFLDDFMYGYGGRVYCNRNGIVAIMNQDGELERAKDFIVCVKYKCGDHDILNLTCGEFLSRFATVDPLKRKKM